jgi:hypothetical protein
MNYHNANFSALTIALAGWLQTGCGHDSVASPGVAPPVATSQPAIEPKAVPAESEPAPTEPAEPDTTKVAVNIAEPAAAPKPESPENDAEPPRAKGQRPPADRVKARPGEAEKITWDDLNLGMPADVVYRPFMLSDRVKELDGKKISILGFIHGGIKSRENIKELILLKNTECKYGPAGQADHLAEVIFAEGKETDYTTTAIKVEGTLTIEPVTGEDGNTWSVFRLIDAVVK